MWPASLRAALGALGLALLIASGARCAYAPNPPDGMLGCSVNRECPEGYSCRAADNKCWKDSSSGSAGAAGGTAGAAGGTGGAGGSGGAPGDKLVGHWIFDAASTLTLACGASTMTKSLKDDYVDVETNAKPGTVKATYYCGWILDEGPAGNAAMIEAGQSCMSTDPMTKAVFTWNGTTFTFTSLDGKFATLSSTIAATYVGTDGTMGSCTIKITGKLAK